MNKNQLIKVIANDFNLSIHEVKNNINIIIDTITNSIKSGEGCEIRGFGSFSRKYKKSRVGINPKTREKTIVEEKFTSFFKTSKELKKIVDNKR